MSQRQRIAAGRNAMLYGDNINILPMYVADESVDLCYADPPFNSNRNYNILYKEKSGKESLGQVFAFEDNWTWNDKAQALYEAMVFKGQAPDTVVKLLVAFRQFLGADHLLAYLVGMAGRLIQVHRVLKPTGTFWLHCDPTASHYLKLILDAVFGPTNYRNEISWRRTNAHSDGAQGRKGLGRVRDIILVYSKTNNFKWNILYTPYNQEYTDAFYKHVESDTERRYRLSDLTAAKGGGDTSYEWKGVKPYTGRYWAYSKANMEEFEREGRLYYSKSGMPSYKRYLDEMPGVPLQDDWADIKPIGAQAKERLGYPTQKPLALLERIIEIGTDEGDVVFDPFCGCGTAIAAAQTLNRHWVGIDLTHLAIKIQKDRLRAMFNLVPKADYDVIGEPVDVGDAEHLAQDDRYQFQWWATSLIEDAIPVGGQVGSKTGKKGADKGIDAIVNFKDELRNNITNQALIQIKSGNVSVRDIRDLVGTLQREGACIGIFVTLKEPTREMLVEAATAGCYYSPGMNREYLKIQILTIEKLLEGTRPALPSYEGILKRAERFNLNQQAAMNF